MVKGIRTASIAAQVINNLPKSLGESTVISSLLVADLTDSLILGHPIF